MVKHTFISPALPFFNSSISSPILFSSLSLPNHHRVFPRLAKGFPQRSLPTLEGSRHAVGGRGGCFRVRIIVDVFGWSSWTYQSFRVSWASVRNLIRSITWVANKLVYKKYKFLTWDGSNKCFVNHENLLRIIENTASWF